MTPHALSPLDGIDTPALLVDVDVMEANMARIIASCRQAGVGWRPHCKSHKSPDIARLQIAAGAIGITCAKLSEAEAMAEAQAAAQSRPWEISVRTSRCLARP